MRHTRADLDTMLARLPGLTIGRIVYHGLSSHDGFYHFFDDSRFDSLDFGLDLEFTNGDVLSVTWDWYDRANMYGLSLAFARLASVQNSGHTLDATATSRWSNALGRTLESALTSWTYPWANCIPEPADYYPEAMTLRFADGNLIIVWAMEIRDGQPLPAGDQITVFNDLDVARAFQVPV